MSKSMDTDREQSVEDGKAIDDGEAVEDLELDPETSAKVTGGLNPQPFPPQFT
jgi:hypothetical protein